MFRKTTNTILVLIVFITTTGFSISLHYCCDSLVSMSVNSDATPCCPVENGCCDNQTKHIQLEENLTTPVSDTIQKLDTVDIFSFDILINSEIITEYQEHFIDFFDSSSPRNLQENLAKLQSFLL